MLAIIGGKPFRNLMPVHVATDGRRSQDGAVKGAI
jgi:hypothetical protein